MGAGILIAVGDDVVAELLRESGVIRAELARVATELHGSPLRSLAEQGSQDGMTAFMI